MSSALEIRDLYASIDGTPVLKGVDLVLPFGEVHALMGPNGSGKSTLSHVLMGKDGYDVSGSVLLDGQELLGLEVNQRAKIGLFAAFQYPVEIAGVSLNDLIAELAAGRSDEFDQLVSTSIDRLGMHSFMDRPINGRLSGGEKKRSEMFQLTLMAPKVALLDEIDSGLDVDAVREVAALVESGRSPQLGVLLVTHYSRILKHMAPDRVHVLVDGRIVRSGGAEVANDVEESGYEGLGSEFASTPDREPPLGPR